MYRPKYSFLVLADEATLIIVNLYVRSFAKIDDVKMEYSVQITFRQQWDDIRLQYEHKLKGKEMKCKFQTRIITNN